MELFTAVASALGAAAGIVAAVGVLIVNAKLDKVIGRVDVLEAGHHAHVNAPGLHQ